MNRANGALANLKGSKSELHDKLVPIPQHMINPRIGIANTQHFGMTMVVMDALSPPLVWHPKDHVWVELQT